MILHDLESYKHQLNFNVSDLSVLANGENENIVEDKIKSKILKLMEKNLNYERTFGCVSGFMNFLSKRQNFKLDNSRLFDYFLKQDKNTANLKFVLKQPKKPNFELTARKTASFHEILKKKSIFYKENIGQIKHFIEVAKDNLSSIKKRSVSLHNLQFLQTKDSFLPLTDRNTLSSYREKTMRSSKKEKSNGFTLNKKDWTELMPLKYRTMNIIRSSRKKFRGTSEFNGRDKKNPKA